MAVADLEGYYKQVHEATIRSAYCGFDVRASTCPAAPARTSRGSYVSLVARTARRDDRTRPTSDRRHDLRRRAWR
jgi:hypothetical protein